MLSSMQGYADHGLVRWCPSCLQVVRPSWGGLHLREIHTPSIPWREVSVGLRNVFNDKVLIRV